MNNSESEKYLADFISHDGKHDATSNDYYNTKGILLPFINLGTAQKRQKKTPNWVNVKG